MTLEIPESIRSFKHRHYTNIYELYPNERRLYGTESLFGDWDGELLLLAKDFAPARLIEEASMTASRARTIIQTQTRIQASPERKPIANSFFIQGI
jgi:hypothetical protein